MLSSIVIPVKELRKPSLALRNRHIALQIDIIVLDCSPETLNEDIVKGTAFTIHADSNAMGFENACKFTARELASLIRIEYLRLAKSLQSFV